VVPPTIRARPVVAAFSRRVREMRHAAGMTQKQVAEIACVRKAFISLIERGKANPSLVTIALIAGALGCDVAAFFGKHTDAA